MAKQSAQQAPQQTQAIIYLRVSTRAQAEFGIGLDAQLSACQAHCQRKGWEMIATFEDRGISGKDEVANRPGLMAVIDCVKANPGACVVVYSVSRLARRQRLLWNLLDDRGDYRLAISSATESFDTCTPSGRAMLGMLATFAALEADMVSERTKDALAELKAQGRKLGAPSVAKLAPASVKQLQALYATNQYTHRSLANHANAVGIPTAKAGSRWHSRTIRQALIAEINA